MLDSSKIFVPLAIINESVKSADYWNQIAIRLEFDYKKFKWIITD